MGSVRRRGLDADYSAAGPVARAAQTAVVEVHSLLRHPPGLRHTGT